MNSAKQAITVIVTLLVVALFGSSAWAKTIHESIANKFQGFGNVELNGNCMPVVCNQAQPVIALHDSIIVPHRYSVFARIANLQNKHILKNKKYSTPSQNAASQMQWGVVFNYINITDYWTALLQCGITNGEELYDKPAIMLSVIHHINGIDSVAAIVNVASFTSQFNNDNIIELEYNEGKLTVLAGKELAQKVCTVDVAGCSPCQMGVYCGNGCDLRVERFVIKSEKNQWKEIETQWTIEKLNQRFEKEHDVNEGYWSYLDRDVDENRLRLGGRYTLALVANGNGYDIIYVKGASVNSSRWKPGMIKGKLTKTRFQGQYDLIWYDAECKPFITDVHATMTDGAVLTLHFPLYKSQLRLSKNEETAIE
ncbi:MAG: hypothetical protein ACI308_05380 [Muribaculaceae bacterium]